MRYGERPPPVVPPLRLVFVTKEGTTRCFPVTDAVWRTIHFDSCVNRRGARWPRRNVPPITVLEWRRVGRGDWSALLARTVIRRYALVALYRDPLNPDVLHEEGALVDPDAMRELLPKHL